MWWYCGCHSWVISDVAGAIARSNRWECPTCFCRSSALASHVPRQAAGPDSAPSPDLVLKHPVTTDNFPFEAQDSLL